MGFGFLDNAIMIVAGDAIDASLGAKFGLSMMARPGPPSLALGINLIVTLEKQLLNMIGNLV